MRLIPTADKQIRANEKAEANKLIEDAILLEKNGCYAIVLEKVPSELAKKVTNEINFKGTVKIAKLAKKAGVQRFIFTSSQSIYGISKFNKENIKSNR